jgi:hypothetical protein
MSSAMQPGATNPYQSPVAAIADPPQVPGAVSAKTMEMLRLTKPWARFFSILGFIGAALMIAGGIAVAVFAGVLGLGGLGPAESAIGIVYVVMGGLYIPGSIYLSRYATRIGNLMLSQNVQDLESALEAQKSFWRFIGLVTATVLVLYLILFVVTVLPALGVLLRSATQ